MPTGVTLVEYKTNQDREKAFVLLSGKTMKDSAGSSIVCKRGKTQMQRDRNSKLQKAEEEIKKQCTHGETVKIDWKERSVTCQDVAAYTQDKDGLSDNSLSPFTQLVV